MKYIYLSSLCVIIKIITYNEEKKRERERERERKRTKYVRYIIAMINRNYNIELLSIIE